jgi:hypothetical protein
MLSAAMLPIAHIEGSAIVYSFASIKLRNTIIPPFYTTFWQTFDDFPQIIAKTYADRLLNSINYL